MCNPHGNIGVTAGAFRMNREQARRLLGVLLVFLAALCTLTIHRLDLDTAVDAALEASETLTQAPFKTATEADTSERNTKLGIDAPSAQRPRHIDVSNWRCECDWPCPSVTRPSPGLTVDPSVREW